MNKMHDSINNYKTTVIYDKKDPYQSGVTFIAIRAETNQPYVFATYFTTHKKFLPDLPDEILIVSKSQARNLFNFKQGSITDLVK